MAVSRMEVGETAGGITEMTEEADDVAEKAVSSSEEEEFDSYDAREPMMGSEEAMSEEDISGGQMVNEKVRRLELAGR